MSVSESSTEDPGPIVACTYKVDADGDLLGSSHDSNFDVEMLLAQIEVSEDSTKCVEQLKELCSILDKNEDAIIGYTNVLVDVIIAQAGKTLKRITQNVTWIRVYKHLLNTQLQLLTKKKVAQKISLQTLQLLIQELLKALMQLQLISSSEVDPLKQAVNFLIHKILEDSDRTRVFTTLLRLLRIAPILPHDSILGKETELVIKCLIKLTKILPTTIDSVILDSLFNDIHLFFVARPPMTWKGKNDMAFRIVKMMIHEIVKLKGDSVFQYLSRVPTHYKPAPILMSYLEVLLNKNYDPNFLFELDIQTPRSIDTTPDTVLQQTNAFTEPPTPSSTSSNDVNYFLEKINSLKINSKGEQSPAGKPELGLSSDEEGSGTNTKKLQRQGSLTDKAVSGLVPPKKSLVAPVHAEKKTKTPVIPKVNMSKLNKPSSPAPVSPKEVAPAPVAVAEKRKLVTSLSGSKLPATGQPTEKTPSGTKASTASTTSSTSTTAKANERKASMGESKIATATANTRMKAPSTLKK